MELDRLLRFEVHRTFQFGEAYNRQEPMRLFVNWDDNEIFFKQIYVLCPFLYTSVAFLGGSQLFAAVLSHRCQALIEESTEDMGFLALLLRQYFAKQPLEIELDDYVVEILFHG